MKLLSGRVQVYETWTIKPHALHRKRKTAFWTEEQINLVVDMYNSGYTAKEIAESLNSLRGAPKRTVAAVNSKLSAILKNQDLVNQLSK